jgi:glycosyltransferase involved in cell wall biosynthesis
MKVLAVTNMFPTSETPAYGVFVRNTLDAIRRADPSIAFDVLFVDGRGRPAAYLAAPLRVLARARRGFDLIHAHYGFLAGAGALFPGPRVITYYGSDVNDARELRWSRPFLARYAGVVVMNETMRARLGRADAAVLPPGIDLALFAPRDRSEARRRLGLDPAARYLLFPSRRSRREKRYDIFSETVARVAASRPDVRPLLLGEPERPDSEVPWVYAASDLLLLTSDSEGSPMAIKEALAMNLPIVSVDVGDVRAAVGTTRRSRIVASQDVEALARAAVELLDEGGASDGREHAARFSIEATARGYLDIYRRVAGARRLPA